MIEVGPGSSHAVIGTAHSTSRGYSAAGSMASSIWLRRCSCARPRAAAPALPGRGRRAE